MMEEEESELSSSSGSYSSSEDESVGEEEEDDDSQEDTPTGGSRRNSRGGSAARDRGGGERRKRRRKLVGRRRELRSKYESVEDFNPEARSAQTEEIERIRRLELQRSLLPGGGGGGGAAAAAVASRLPTTPTSDSVAGEASPNLLGSGTVFRNLAEDDGGGGGRERVVDAIIISSDSDEEEQEAVQAERRKREAERVGGGVNSEVKRETVAVEEEEAEVEEAEKGGRYDVVGKREASDQVVINLGHPHDEEDVILPPQIARIIKPHQVGGVRFLYDNLIESLSRFQTSTGFGCILAHSMGLGKTLQVITFIDIFFRYTSAKHVLCVVPVNTLQNWVVEFDKWLPDKEQEELKKRTGSNVSATGKSSKSRNKRSQKNGRLPKVSATDHLIQTNPSSSSPSSFSSSPSTSSMALPFLPLPDIVNSLPAINDIMSSSGAEDTSSLLVGGAGGGGGGGAGGGFGAGAGGGGLGGGVGVPLSDTDQQLLLNSLLQPLTSTHQSGNHAQTTPTNLAVPQSESQPHTPSSGVGGNSRSLSASPNVPEIQYRNFRLWVLSESHRNMESRLKLIKQWRAEGGVLLIGYEMYRLLSLSVPSLGGNKMAVKRRKTTKASSQQNNLFVDLEENEREMEKLMEIQRALCVPGPDLVVCDEGHRIKNDYSNISQALKKIRTRRRVVLTGYPLQNNLLEYWCMVDFVRPKYLGTKQEFCDLFERPISNGQCTDSTPKDVRTMRYRSHVLHTLLKGFVLRRGHEILKNSLPMKFEHVLLVRPSPLQAALYDYNMNSLQQGGTSTTAGPLKAFAICTKIWNHPDIYYNEATKLSDNTKKSSSTNWQDEVAIPRNLLLKGEKTETGKVEWPVEALAMLPPFQTGRLDNSPKMVVTMEILDRSVQLGDKLLIFSQSLSTLSYIESLLVRRPIPIPHSTGPMGEVQYSGTMWTKNVNYCRLDGSTGSADRDRLINAFNSPSNTEMWVFLLSTRAGCLGINLIGANRVIVLDVSWNPCYDAQAVCRVYRYGQTKACHIYRLVCDGMMERKIYDRQISKQGMADRVVDELQPERHFSADEIITLMRPLALLPPPQDLTQASGRFVFDQILFILCQHFGPLLTKTPFRHESLLLDSAHEKMTEVEKWYAMQGFQQDWNARKRNNVVVAATPSVHSNSVNISSSHQSRNPGVPASSLTTPTLPRPSLPASTSSSLLHSQGTGMYGTPRVASHLPPAVSSTTTSSLYPNPHFPIPCHSGSNLQYGHSSIPTPPTSMGNENVTMTNSVICLDSDSESEGLNQLQTVTSGSHPNVPSQSTSTTLLPGPKVLTVPISSTVDHTHSLSGGGGGGGMPLSGHTPNSTPTVDRSSLNVAVSQLIEYMKHRGGSASSSPTPANTLPLNSHVQTPSSSSGLVLGPDGMGMRSHVASSSSGLVLGSDGMGMRPHVASSSSGLVLGSDGMGMRPHVASSSSGLGLGSDGMGMRSHVASSSSGLVLGSDGMGMRPHMVDSTYTSGTVGDSVSAQTVLSADSGLGQSSVNPGQFPGHPIVNNLGQLPGHQIVNSGQQVPFHGQMLPTSSDGLTQHPNATSSTLPQLSPTLTSLLNTTTNNNIAPSPTRIEPPPPPPYPFTSTSTSTSSSSSSSPFSIPQQSSTTSSQLIQNELGMQHQLHSVNSSTVPTSGGISLHTILPEATTPSNLPLGSPTRPLFSPPKMPLYRETGGSNSTGIISSSRSQNNPPAQFPFPSPPSLGQAPVPSPSPPPPFSPSRVSTPPTPSTSIPLLSPVAAHLFHVSMSKSPKPSPSPSRTPTPSPSPHQPSPPSVQPTTETVAKTRPTAVTI